jgi:hypothetical protein
MSTRRLPVVPSLLVMAALARLTLALAAAGLLWLAVGWALA